MKNLIILISILISNLAFGQDGISWGFEIKFKIETEETWRANLLADFEFLINDRYFDHSGYVQEYKTVKYESISKEYKIIMNYSGIGGESQVAYVHCPEIYIKACFSKDPFWKVGEYYTFIALYFENAKGSHQKYNLGTIKLSEFANDYIEVKEENIVLPPYEVIEVKADKTMHKKSKGQYEPRRMNKMVKLKLENEN
jgi:hypothetical protein